MDVLTVLIVLALAATVIALLLGLAVMGGRKELDRELSGPLMWVRVGLQGFAILLLLIAIMLN